MSEDLEPHSDHLYMCAIYWHGFLQLELCFSRKCCAFPAAVRWTVEKQMLQFLVMVGVERQHCRGNLSADQGKGSQWVGS